MREFMWSVHIWDKTGNTVIEKISGSFLASGYDSALKMVRKRAPEGSIEILVAKDEAVRLV